MSTIIKIGLGIALALPLSTSITTVKVAYGIVEAPSSFMSLNNMSPKELGAHSPLSAEQLSAIQGMAGICISCLHEPLIDDLARNPGQRYTSSVDQTEVTVYQANQSVARGAVSQSNQSMVIQTSSPSGQQHSVLKVRQIQTLTTQFPNGKQDTNLAQKINTSTRNFICQNLSQHQNALQPIESPIGSGKSLAREIISTTQGIINQAARNGTVNTPRINHQFTNIPNGGFLR